MGNFQLGSAWPMITSVTKLPFWGYSYTFHHQDQENTQRKCSGHLGGKGGGYVYGGGYTVIILKDDLLQGSQSHSQSAQSVMVKPRELRG